MSNVEGSTPGSDTETSIAPIAPAAGSIAEEPAETDQEETMKAAASMQSMRTTTTGKQCLKFHIPALVGWPNAGRASLRQRPTLASSNPQIRKSSILTAYIMLIGQKTITALTAGAITAAILSPGLLPQVFGVHASAPSTATLFGGSNSSPYAHSPVTGYYWMPGYPINIIMMLSAVCFCTMLSFAGLSCARGKPGLRRALLVVTTLATGIFIGLFTYLDNSFAMLFIGIVWMSLVVHFVGVALNFVSCVASSMGPVTLKASKTEIMARTSLLTGTEKCICLLNDEDGASTRAAFLLAGLSWIAATVTAAVIVATHDLSWNAMVFAALMSCPVVAYFTYGVEKQVRRCKPDEIEKMIVNLNVDFLFFVAGCLSLDLSIISWQELGTARPCPLDKGVFQYAMKQVASVTTQSTCVSSSTSRSSRAVSEQRVSVAV